MRTSPRLALLDLDGTLTDSAPGIMASIADAYRELGLTPPTTEVLRTFVGPPIADNLLGHGVPAEQLDAGIAAYRRSYAAGGMYDNRVYPGILDCLTTLRAAGVTLAVATSKPESFAVPICEHLGLAGHLDAIFGASLGGTRTTKAEVVGYALERLGAGEESGWRRVMVGDRSHDVHGARAHGIDCLGVAWGYAAPGELADAGAVAVVDTPQSLAPAVLARLS